MLTIFSLTFYNCICFQLWPIVAFLREIQKRSTKSLQLCIYCSIQCISDVHNVPEIAIVDTTNTVQDTVVKVLNNTTTITIKTTIIIIVQIRTNQALEAALKVQALLGEEFLELISICQAPLVV